MSASRRIESIEGALALFEEARRRDPSLSLEVWRESCRAEGVELPDGLLELRDQLAALALDELRRVVVEEPRPLEPGELVSGARFGPFVLVHRIRSGGMSEVWRAMDSGGGPDVALKFLDPRHCDAEALRRFEREAAIGRRLSDPRLLRTISHDAGGSSPWIALELVEGGDLADELRDHARLDRPDGEWYRQVALWGRDLALATAALHEAGVLHRDLKPANALVTPDGELRVADFGLAQVRQASTLTLPGHQLGTYAYMSPEQIRGEPLGPASDLFSIGTILYELLTLQRPFAGDTPAEILHKILRQEATDPREVRAGVPTELATLTLRCMEKSPRRRLPLAAFLAEELERFLEGAPIRTRPRSRLRAAASLARANPAPTALLTVSILAASGLALLSSRLGSANSELRDRELELQAPKTRDDARRLIDDFEDLHPASLAKLPEIDAWISRAEELVARLHPFETTSGAVHPGFAALDEVGPRTGVEDGRLALRALERLESREGAILESEVDPGFGWGARRLRREVLRMAAIVEDEETDLKWAAVRERIARDPRFRDLRLRPQDGLVPIGPDPVTGLEEFWHVLTGEEPRRDQDGVLQMREDSGVVLVLLPGGSFGIGGQAEDPTRPYYDAAATPSPAPFPAFQERLFISKFELTVGQWERIRGPDPSSNPYRHYRAHPLGVFPSSERLDATVPVNSVSHARAEAAMRQVGLLLPNQVEWEFAARGGTSTTWWTGDEMSNLQLAENLRDLTAFEHRQDEFSSPHPWYDGWVLSAPAQAGLPNPFGLHHVHGNVREWLRTDPEADPRAQAGLAEETATERGIVAFRGGYYDGLADAASSARRHVNLGHAAPSIGIRAAKTLDPRD